MVLAVQRTVAGSLCDQLLHARVRFSHGDAADEAVRWGCIVFTGSDQALQPDADLGPYAQAKAATHSFERMLARELASDGIRVNVVAPGMTRTPLVEILMEQRAREFGTDFRSAEHMDRKQR